MLNLKKLNDHNFWIHPLIKMHLSIAQKAEDILP